MNVECDECKKEFNIAIKEQKHPKGVTESYFICPHCGHKYPVSFTNARARKCQRQIGELWNEIRGCRSIQLAETKKAKIDKLTEENKQIMDELKKRFASK